MFLWKVRELDAHLCFSGDNVIAWQCTGQNDEKKEGDGERDILQCANVYDCHCEDGHQWLADTLSTQSNREKGGLGFG